MIIARALLNGESVVYGKIIDDVLYPLTNSIFDDNPIASQQGYTSDDFTLLAPCDPSKIIAVGRNYADHIQELDNVFPENPLVFFKPPSAVIGTGATIVHPKWTSELHYEAELAVVMKRQCKDITPAQVPEHILGYTCANDITARDIQKTDIQWWRAKGADGFCPLGPWIQTELESGKVQIRSYVNGELRQNGSTAQMLGTIADLISYISSALTLYPGDVILTGTPGGVGKIIPGDHVKVSIAEIGDLINIVT